MRGESVVRGSFLLVALAVAGCNVLSGIDGFGSGDPDNESVDAGATPDGGEDASPTETGAPLEETATPDATAPPPGDTGVPAPDSGTSGPDTSFDDTFMPPEDTGPFDTGPVDTGPPPADTSSIDTAPVDTGFSCVGRADGTPCGSPGRLICLGGVCKTGYCGDKFVDTGASEECDDGNTVNGDGCDNDCSFSCASTLKPTKKCDDGVFCNGLEKCSGHTCLAGTPVVCTPPVACKKSFCSESAKGCVTSLIDKDGDGHGPASSPPVFPCDDCDDGNANGFPGQTLFFATATAKGSFDYDCNGTAEQEITTVGMCKPLTCGFSVGWQFSAAACGVTAKWIEMCESRDPDPGCMVTTSDKTQRCR